MNKDIALQLIQASTKTFSVDGIQQGTHLSFVPDNKKACYLAGCLMQKGWDWEKWLHYTDAIEFLAVEELGVTMNDAIDIIDMNDIENLSWQEINERLLQND